MKKRIFVIFCLLLLCVCSLFANKSEAEKELGLTRKLLYETARVLELPNNQAVLDEIYTYSWYPDISYINSEYIQNFKDDIAEYKSIEVKRERLLYIYNQKKSIQFASLVPDVFSVVTIASTAPNPKQAVIAIAGTALGSITNYLSTKNTAELLQSQWTLDDDAAKNFNNLNNTIFGTLTYLSKEYGFTRKDIASINTIRSFVRMVQTMNEPQDILIKCLGTNYEKELKYFSDFWRVIATASYELGEYEKTLEYIKFFEQYYENVFSHDKNYSQILLIKAYCIDATYIDAVEKAEALLSIVGKIRENLSPEGDWEQKYYCYLTYKDIAQYLNNPSYLDDAFELLGEVFSINIDQYKADLDSYLNLDDVVKIEKEINGKISEYDKQIAEKKELKKNTKSKEKDKIIDNEIKAIEEKKSKLTEDKKVLLKNTNKTLPPSTVLVAALANDYIELAKQLNMTNDFKYRTLISKFDNSIQDDYNRIIFFGDSLVAYDVDANYTYNDKVLCFGNDIDVMKFYLPMSYFSMNSDTLDDTSLVIFNTQYGYDFEIPYNEESSETGWSFEVIRPESKSEFNMYNVQFLIIVRFKEPMAILPKDESAPAMYFTFKSVDNPLERVAGFNVIDVDNFRKGFFKVK